MVNKLKACIAIICIVLLGGAWPNSGRVYPPGTTQAPPNFVGPGDVVASAGAWYSCSRAYSMSYSSGANKMCNVSRASDSHTCDIMTSGSGTNGLPGNTANCSSGADNGQSASSFCNATTCSITKTYDQSGHGNDLAQATAADQPTLTFNCISTFNCMTNVTNGGLAISAITGIANPNTCSMVYKITTAGTNVVIGGDNNSGAAGWVCYEATANHFSLYAGGGGMTVTANDNVLHAAQGVFNTATSTTNVDGAETAGGNAGNSNGTTSRGLMENGTGGAGNMTGFVAEDGAWGVAFSSGQRTSMCQNEQAFYGAVNFGAAC